MAHNWHPSLIDPNVFAAPLNPDMFAALEANGVLPPLNQHTPQWSHPSPAPSARQRHTTSHYPPVAPNNGRHALPPSLWMSPSQPANSPVNHIALSSLHDLPPSQH